MEQPTKNEKQAVLDALNNLRNQHNELQKEIARLKKAGSDPGELVAKQRDVARAIEIEQQKLGK